MTPPRTTVTRIEVESWNIPGDEELKRQISTVRKLGFDAEVRYRGGLLVVTAVKRTPA